MGKGVHRYWIVSAQRPRLTSGMTVSDGSTPVVGDSLGLALLDYLERGAEARSHFIERDDGFLEIVDTAVMFSDDSEWSKAEAPIAERVGRRVLDVGAGSGRHAVPLQQSGRDVVALDVSPGAVAVCERRGIRETFVGTIFELASTSPEPFDTFILGGNNFGLLESPEHAPRFLGALRELAVPGAEIIGTCVDPFGSTDPLHLGYHDRNRTRGRHPGQLRLRVRWTNIVSPWFEYWFLPVTELEMLAESEGWELVAHNADHRPYLAMLRLRDKDH